MFICLSYYAITLCLHRFGLLKNQALADSSKAESLLTRCTGIPKHILNVCVESN